jgi:hypothetical protein
MAIVPPISSPVPGMLFEVKARRVLSALWGVTLEPHDVSLAVGVRHKFDLVSGDGEIVGDAKYYKNIPVPAAKWSTIAEYVWLLQHAKARRRFIVFGHDRKVPERWLERYRLLTEGIEFFFLDDDDQFIGL